jgi:hypothetical protein
MRDTETGAMPVRPRHCNGRSFVYAHQPLTGAAGREGERNARSQETTHIRATQKLLGGGVVATARRNLLVRVGRYGHLPHFRCPFCIYSPGVGRFALRRR